MKFLLSFLLLCSIKSHAIDVFSQIPVDKKLHFFASYGLTYTVSDFLKSRNVEYSELWASLFAGTIGAIKETTIDDKLDRDDMKANLVGLGLAAGIHYGIRW